MFFIICSWTLRRAYPAWAPVIFGLALFSPGLVIHVSTDTIRVTWAEALAETRLTNTDESILTLNQAIELAITGNPGLAEIRARAEAMAAVPSQEGTLPDPTLKFGALYLPTSSFNLHQDDFTMMEVGVSQEIPFPGKLGLREKNRRAGSAGRR